MVTGPLADGTVTGPRSTSWPLGVRRLIGERTDEDCRAYRMANRDRPVHHHHGTRGRLATRLIENPSITAQTTATAIGTVKLSGGIPAEELRRGKIMTASLDDGTRLLDTADGRRLAWLRHGSPGEIELAGIAAWKGIPVPGAGRIAVSIFGPPAAVGMPLGGISFVGGGAAGVKMPPV